MAIIGGRSADRILVVGSGPCGAGVARALVERGAEVVIIEQGAAVTQPPGAHLRNGETYQRDPDDYFGAIEPYLASPAPRDASTSLPAARVTHAVGGQGIVWTNNCPRAVPGLERWDIDDDWDRLYALAERYLSVEPVRGSERQERIRARLAEAGRVALDQPFAGRFVDAHSVTYVAPADILEPVADRVRIERARVRRVVIEAGRAVGVEIDDAILPAAGVIVAAGALETPGVLHRSGLRSPAAGRWLSYHEVLVTQVVLDDALIEDVTTHDLPPRLMLPPEADRPWHVMVLRDTNPLVPTAPDEDIDPRRLIEIQAFCPIDPRRQNRLLPANGAIHVTRSPDDQARMAAVERDVRSMVGALGRTRSGCGPTWLPAGAHVIGTCRMGSDRSTAVADTRGRVHGVESLWLATVGLIPTRMAVNPTLTGVAMAIHTAGALA